MPQTTRTDKKPYKSTYSDLYVDAPNYLAELVCQKYATQNNFGKLPQYFWRMPKFTKKYQMEVSQARKLLKEFAAGAIIAALNAPASKFITSLRNKKLMPIIQQCQNRVKDVEFIPSIKEDTVDSVSRQTFSNKNNLRNL